MLIVATLMLNGILAAAPWLLQGERSRSEAVADDQGRRLQSLSLTAATHSPSPHYTVTISGCTTTDEWITWTCSPSPREIIEG